MKNFLISIGIAALVMGVFMMLRSSPESVPATPISNNLEVRGKQLRTAIDQAYKRMSDAQTIRGRWVNITSVVVPYIPAGMSFDDAEQVLRSAGFEVKPRPGPKGLKDHTDPYKYNVEALIKNYTNPYLNWLSSPFGVSIAVDLTPKAPRDYTKVLRVEASILVSDI